LLKIHLLFRNSIPQGIELMQTLLLSCAFGAVCTMVLWAAGAAAVRRDEMMRRGGRLAPPDEL
jgi:hypothetical protein